jgi:hypothetical protein
MAIAAMILGIVGLFPGVFLGLLLGIPSLLAVIFGHIAKSKCQRDPDLKGSGMAVTGIILGYVALAILSIGTAVVLLLAINS